MTTTMTRYLFNLQQALGNNSKYNNFIQKMENLVNETPEYMQELIGDFVSNKLPHTIESLTLDQLNSWTELMSIKAEDQNPKYSAAFAELQHAHDEEKYEGGAYDKYAKLWAFARWFQYSPEDVKDARFSMKKHTENHEKHEQFFKYLAEIEELDDTDSVAYDYIVKMAEENAYYLQLEGQALGLGSETDEESITKRIETMAKDKVKYLFDTARDLFASYAMSELMAGHKFNELDKCYQIEAISRYKDLQARYCMA